MPWRGATDVPVACRWKMGRSPGSGTRWAVGCMFWERLCAWSYDTDTQGALLVTHGALLSAFVLQQP